jgi:hypothetical protein
MGLEQGRFWYLCMRGAKTNNLLRLRDSCTLPPPPYFFRLGFELRAHICKAGTLLLEPHL